MEIPLNIPNEEEIKFNKNPIKFYDVITEPHYCIQRKLFSVPSDNITEFEKKKMQNFLEVLKNEQNLLKKMESLSSHDFNFFRDVLDDETTLRFLNMFSYDVYKTINNIEKFLDLIKKLKISEEILKELFNKDEESKIIHEESAAINSTMTSNLYSKFPTSILASFYLMGKDIFDRPIVAIELLKLLQDSQKMPFYDILHNVIRVIKKIILKECRKGDVEQIIIFLDIRDFPALDSNDEVIKLFQYLFPSRVYRIYMQMSKSVQFINNLKKTLLLYNLDRVKLFGKSKVEVMKEEIDWNIINSFFITGQRKLYSLYRESTNPLLESKLETHVSQSHMTYDINHKDLSQEISIQKGYDANNKFLFNIDTESHTNEVCTILSKNLNNISWSNSHSIKIDSAEIFSINNKKKDEVYFKTSNFSQLTVEDFAFTIKSQNKYGNSFVRKEILLEKDKTPGCCSNDCRII
jgi:hypothetical protein